MRTNKPNRKKNSDLPLTLWLQNGGEPLVRQETRKNFANLDKIMFGYWGEITVLAKIFSNLKSFHEELKTLSRLQALNIKVPTVLYQGRILKHPAYVILYEKPEPFLLLDEQLKNSTHSERKPMMFSLLSWLIKLHDNGFNLKTFSFKNFLWQPSEIIFFSGTDGLQKKSSHPITEILGLKDLALILANLPLSFDEEIEQWCPFYLKGRGFIFTLEKLAQLKTQIALCRSKGICKKYQAINNVSKIHKHRVGIKTIVYQTEQTSDIFKKTLIDPESIMQNVQSRLLKAGDTTTLMKAFVGNQPVIIKRYNIKSIWHGIRRAFRRSRAAVCWNNAHYLTDLNLLTPKPLAYIEKRLGFFRRQAYFIMEYLPGINLLEFCTDPKRKNFEIEVVAKKVIQLINNLAQVRLSHGDLKATNILLVNDEPVLLDLDAMRLHPSRGRWSKARKRDLRRFMKNWRNYPEVEKIFSPLISEETM